MTAQIHGVPVVNAYYDHEARAVRVFCGWYDTATRASCSWHAFEFDRQADILVDAAWPCARGGKVILRVWPSMAEWHRQEFDHTSNRNSYVNHRGRRRR